MNTTTLNNVTIRELEVLEEYCSNQFNLAERENNVRESNYFYNRLETIRAHKKVLKESIQ